MYYSERFNAYSHLAGFLLAMTVLVLMLVKVMESADGYRIAGVLIYGICPPLLYLGSTLYHSISQPKVKAILQKVNHCTIYPLIAGSYTPLTLIILHGGWSWSLLGVSWGLALLGIVQELTIGRKNERRLLSMVIYVLMGRLIMVAVWPLIQSLSAGGLFWLVLGGILYGVGIYWFINDTKVRHGRGIWYSFVLIGSLMQSISIYFYVLQFQTA